MAIFEIQPATNFPITRLVPDLGDGVTYYVQAVVRYATTGVAIATVNLTSQGNRLWSHTWRVLADSIGQGLFVTITTTVYTDSGYTVPSLNYYPENDTYFVFDRYNYVAQLATQVAAQVTIPDLDYKRIAKIVVASLKGIEFPNYPYTDWTPHFERIAEAVKTGVESITIPELPEQQPTDLTPLHEAIKGSESRLHARFDGLPLPEKLDLSPVLEALKGPDITEPAAKIKEINDITKELKDRLDLTMPELGRYLDEITGHLKDFLYITSQKQAKAPKPDEKIEGPVITRDNRVRQ